MYWKFHASVGDLFIVPLKNGGYGFLFDGEIWEACSTPQAVADNIYMGVTPCDAIEDLPDLPGDLSEWEFIPES